MKRKQLYFISPRDMRKNRADCVHIMKICQQFAALGYDVVLVTPRVYRPEYPVPRRDVFALYGMDETFGIVELPTILTDRTSNVLGRIQRLLVFGLYYLREWMHGRLGLDAILYSKCYISTFPAIILRRSGLLKCRLFFEKSEFTSGNRMHRLVAESTDGVVCINRYIHGRVLDAYALPRARVHRLGFPTQYPEVVAHIAATPLPSRGLLGLPAGKRLVIYAGKVDPTMLEIGYILEAARLVPEEEFCLVGVKESSRPWFNKYLAANQIKNVTLIGFQPLQRFYDYVRSADLLVSYYDSQDPLSSTQRSPAKVSVYLCFGRPVIMADLPSLREWWSDEQIFFVPPDEPALLAEKVRYIFAHPDEARARSSKCVEFAKSNTYEAAYSEVGRFIDSCGNPSAAVDCAVHAPQNGIGPDVLSGFNFTPALDQHNERILNGEMDSKNLT